MIGYFPARIFNKTNDANLVKEVFILKCHTNSMSY